MVLQQKIPVIPTQAVASYDFEDLATGLGYETYYLIYGVSGVYMIPFSAPGMGTFSIQYSVGANQTITTTSQFNNSRTIKGTAYLSGTGSWYAHGTAIFKLYLVSGGVETLVGTSATISQTGLSQTFFVDMPLTQTHIKRGDYLRLKVTTTDHEVIYFFDPVTTPFNIHIPFRTDIA